MNTYKHMQAQYIQYIHQCSNIGLGMCCDVLQELQKRFESKLHVTFAAKSRNSKLLHSHPLPYTLPLPTSPLVIHLLPPLPTSYHANVLPPLPVDIPFTLHTSTSAPHSISRDNHTICFEDSLSLGPFTSTNCEMQNSAIQNQHTYLIKLILQAYTAAVLVIT